MNKISRSDLLKERGCFKTFSEEETVGVGRWLARLLKGGDVVCLNGELGAGKTCMARGIALGLGVENERLIKSPSYTLINNYSGEVSVSHIDLYRLEKLEELEELGLEELMESDGVSLIEWGEKFPDILPMNRLDIFLEFLDESTRKVKLIPQGRWLIL
ncbi:MAG: tRNA (adenosine(37)-N6)-threonylcarbamoyltransferase complex ATPase subunit type 1 TsaE [Candidatus Tectomicrobia bacterium]|nr:tRNA (adenosine(37)-N6)-threonylcarbamoyltransferase complex ATPase subunit type 1 TsaE [Candidatus Tectomicrobia bacterium]